MIDTVCGPAAMATEEKSRVTVILDKIYGDGDRGFINGLLSAATWATVYDRVSREKPGLFNALNLATLQTGRPAPLEAPSECAPFQSGEELLNAWLAWYVALDEEALPAAEAERKAT